MRRLRGIDTPFGVLLKHRAAAVKVTTCGNLAILGKLMNRFLDDIHDILPADVKDRVADDLAGSDTEAAVPDRSYFAPLLTRYVHGPVRARVRRGDLDNLHAVRYAWWMVGFRQLVLIRILAALLRSRERVAWPVGRGTFRVVHVYEVPRCPCGRGRTYG